MIPAASITAWARDAPWPSRDQIEQDLVLSRLICEVAFHPMLGDELVFRGGTCLHKLHLPQARDPASARVSYRWQGRRRFRGPTETPGHNRSR